jgi:hypothetical protein
MAGKPLGKVAMTATERQRKWRDKVRRRERLAGHHDRPSLRTPLLRENDRDFWPTPPCLAAALIEQVLPALPEAAIWEAAAGGGHLADPLRAAGRHVISDIERQRRDILQHDYLRGTPPAATKGAIMATNPPYVQIDEFLARTLSLLDSGHLSAAVLLERPDFAATIGRADMLNRAVLELTCCWRVRWIPGTATQPRWWAQWFAWQAGCDGPPVNRRLRQADLRGSAAKG